DGVGAGLWRRLQGGAQLRLLDRSAADARAGHVCLPRPLVPDPGHCPGRIPQPHAAAVGQVGDGQPAGGGISVACPSSGKLVMMILMKRQLLALVLAAMVFLSAPGLALAQREQIDPDAKPNARLEGYAENV